MALETGRVEVATSRSGPALTRERARSQDWR